MNKITPDQLSRRAYVYCDNRRPNSSPTIPRAAVVNTRLAADYSLAFCAVDIADASLKCITMGCGVSPGTCATMPPSIMDGGRSVSHSGTCGSMRR